MRPGIDRLGGRYRLRMADDIGRARGFLAGDDERRADELNRALRDPDVRGIIMARGGYGIMRILADLDAAALAADPKPIVGFSDGTALLSWAYQIAGVCGIHGPVVSQLGALPEADAAWLLDMLEGKTPTGEPIMTGLRPCGAASSAPIEGPLIGGNLCLVSHLAKTPWAAEIAGAIVLIEEVDEKPYAIDRFFTHLLAAGALAGASGALLGDFTACIDPRYPDATWRDVVDERLRAAGLVGLADAPIGHGTRNLAVPFGGRVTVDPQRGAIELIDPAVC